MDIAWTYHEHTMNITCTAPSKKRRVNDLSMGQLLVLIAMFDRSATSTSSQPDIGIKRGLPATVTAFLRRKAGGSEVLWTVHLLSMAVQISICMYVSK